MIERQCDYCANKILRYESQIHKLNFCSRDCHNKYLIGKQSKCKITRIKKQCINCGKTFDIRPKIKENGRGKFCSIKCNSLYNWRLRKNRQLIHIITEETKWKIKNTLKGKQKSKKHCERIGISKRGEKHPNWKNGISFLPYCFLFNECRRIAVRIFFGYYCICCGKHVTENIIKRFGQVEHCVHHVDHDKEQGCNGKPFNLVPMCHECHGKEQHHEQEYKDYINKTLEDGFNWGIWSREQYEREVMYPE